MTIVSGSASDSTYHSRHARRTLGRAEQIGENIDKPGSLLDVGCNNGITSKYLLDAGKAQHVTGIELHASTVEESLRNRADFSLIEGNVVEIELEQKFDHIVYGAVHHHILNLFGLSAAIETLQKLATHCNEHLFFETGQLGEGGRWGWQGPMRRRFRTDEEHFFYLLRSIEHLIDGFEVIASYWIHGIRRQYLRIDMKKGADDQVACEERMARPATAEGPFVRGFGSRDAGLSNFNEAINADSPTRFWICSQDKTDYFLKQHLHLPCAAEAEWVIGRQVDEEWAVQPEARAEPDGALVFPYLRDAVPIKAFALAPLAERRKLAAAVLDVFSDARDRSVQLPQGVLLSDKSRARLIDVVDLNANNFLVLREGECNILRVVDFEMQSTDYASRNRIHQARILWSLGQARAKAMMFFVAGWSGIGANLLRYQFRPFAERVVAKQPSLFSLIVSDVRSAAGRLLAFALKPFGLS